MTPRILTSATAILLSLHVSLAMAQPVGKPPTTGTDAAQTTEPTPPTPTSPRPLEVSDPALAPVPPAKRILKTWQDTVTVASTRSADLIIAVQEVARAEALSDQALGNVLPQINARGTADYTILPRSSRTELDTSTGRLTSVSNNTIGLTASITASQPILAPRAWYALGTTKLGIDAAKLSLEDRRRTILAVVADSVVSVVTAERVSEINRVGLKSALERLELTKRRERLGTGTKLDVVRAEQDVALARASLVSGDEALLQAREALGIALGINEPVGVLPTFSLNAIEQELRSTCSPSTLDQRPDVRAAKIEQELTERDITDAQLALAPTADISTTFSVFSETRGGHNYQWSIQATLTIPIWDGGSRYAAIRAARASAEQQKARVDVTERAANLENNQANRGVLVAERTRVIAEQTRDLARETARLSQVAFEAGTATSFDLVDSGRRQREAELDLAVREFQLVKAKIAALLASANCKY